MNTSSFAMASKGEGFASKADYCLALHSEHCRPQFLYDIMKCMNEIN